MYTGQNCDQRKFSPKGAKPNEKFGVPDPPGVGYRGQIKERLFEQLCSTSKTMRNGFNWDTQLPL